MMKWLKPLGAACFLAMLCLNPGHAAYCALDALRTWALSIAPALLPFLIASPALTCPEVASLLSRFTGSFIRLFRLPVHSTGALLIALLSGSPGGAAALAGIRRHPSDPPGAFVRAAWMASGASPAFLISGIASGMLNAPQTGMLLLRSQLCALLLSGVLLRSCGRERPALLNGKKQASQGTVLCAVQALLCIAGYMTLFSVLAGQFCLLLGPSARTPLLAVLELAGGCRALAALPAALELKLPLISAAACLGGVSVCAQCLSFLEPLGINRMEYAAGKLVQSALCALLTFLQLRMPPLSPEPQLACLFILTLLLALLALRLCLRRRSSPAAKRTAASDAASETAA